MKSKDLIIALGILLVVLIVGLYFMVQKAQAPKALPICTAYSCSR